MDEKMLSLPWQIQVALGCGYAAYALSYAGIREHHKATDITFKSIAFGLVAIVLLLATASWHPVWAVIDAVVGCLVAGFLWRRFGLAWLKDAMKASDASWADDVPTAWATITVCNSTHPVSQIAVEMEDGRVLQCLDASKFADKPHGPFTIGVNGDVAMYVTNTRSSAGSQDVTDVVVPYWGSEITYIPANRIRSVMLRHYTGD